MVTGCTSHDGSTQLLLGGNAVFQSAQNPPVNYPVAGTHHALSPGQTIDLQITLHATGKTSAAVLGNRNANCPPPGLARPFTVIFSTTATAGVNGIYNTLLNTSGMTADFGAGCTTSNFTTQSIDSADVVATNPMSNDTCMNYFVNQALRACETECVDNVSCTTQCPQESVAGIAHACSPISLSDPLSPKEVLAHPVMSAKDLNVFLTVLQGGAITGGISDLDLEFNSVGPQTLP